jgi:hypothetical protein
MEAGERGGESEKWLYCKRCLFFIEWELSCFRRGRGVLEVLSFRAKCRYIPVGSSIPEWNFNFRAERELICELLFDAIGQFTCEGRNGNLSIANLRRHLFSFPCQALSEKY